MEGGGQFADLVAEMGPEAAAALMEKARTAAAASSWGDKEEKASGNAATGAGASPKLLP